MLRLSTLIALLALVAGVLTGCDDLRIINPQVEGPPAEVPLAFQGFTMTSYGTDEHPTQIVRARHAMLYQDSQRAELDDLSLEFYEGMRVVSTLEAERGRTDLLSNTFVAEGVTERIRIVRHDQGVILYALDFMYDPETSELFTNRGFTLLQRLDDGSVQEIQGQMIRTDSTLQRVRLTDFQQRNLGSIDIDAYERDHRPLNQETDS